MKKTRVFAFALIAIVLWSTSGTAFKLALRGISFPQLLFISSHVAWIFLFTLLLIKGRLGSIFKDPSKNIPWSALGGFLNPFLYYIILLKAYSILPAQIAQPLNYTWPVMLVLLSSVFLGQKLIVRDLLAILISFSGVIVISSQGSLPFTQKINEPFGVILAVGSSIIWASFWIINVKDKRPELEKIALNFFFGAIFTTVYLGFFDKLPELNINWIPAVYVGLTEMALAFVFWLTALSNTANNAKISNLVFISPFLALVFIHLILGEEIYFTTPIGLALIVGGIIFQQLSLRRKKQYERQAQNNFRN